MGDFFTKIFGASWLTTVFGLLAAVFAGLAALPPGTLPVGIQGWLQFLMAIAISGGLVSAKSFNVTNAPKPAVAAIVVAESAPNAVTTRKITP